MKKLNINCKILTTIIFSFFFTLLLSNKIFSNEIPIKIEGNNFTDANVIISLLDNIPDNIDQEYTNEIIKILNDSNLFSKVSVSIKNDKYVIKVIEYPNIDKLYFKKNERLDDEELRAIASELQFNRYNEISINKFIKELKNIYQSFGYNNMNIEYSTKTYKDINTVDIFFTINEGTLTKISNIFINGNNSIIAQEIKGIIKSKTRSFRNIFANNNYKPITVERDKFLITNYYKNNGFIDILIDTQIEYLKSNKVNIYFNINEGSVYNISSIKFIDENNLLNPDIKELINIKIDNYKNTENIFSINNINNLKNEISSIIIENGIEFFEIISLEKRDNNNVDIIFNLLPIKPKYTNQINISGNSRTFDYVIRRELEIIEGDAIYKNQINKIREKLISTDLFESVSISEETIDENKINLIIKVEEKQTGTFNAGVSVGTLDGFAIVTGLRENNFYGTGRSLDVLVNTSEDKNQFKLTTSDRLSYENDANISYSINYKQQDFSKASSYKLDTFTSGVGLGYRLNKSLYHSLDLEYVLKDYKITDSSAASETILSSSGSNMSYLITNNIRYSTLNPGFISKKGRLINYNNTIETPTSSSNGYVRNILTAKQFHSVNENNIFSIQAKIGNIFSLANNDILTDDKFSLGGKWLRGFDNYGVGPRNSRTSYIGGNNIAVTKLDYSHEITNKSNFPIYLNIFNDYGLVWENKTKPTQSNNSLRASAGFGIKYYSPIGPIGFSWGFPIMDEDYDIKRMFLFSIGNLD